MNFRKSLAALAFAGMALAGSAHAQVTPTSYTDGDLFLGFRATGGTGQTSDYLVNIGQVSTYVNATGTVSVPVTGMKADLDATFGSSWKSRSDVLWSVSGKEQASVTLYATKPQTTPGVINATGWARKSDSTQAQPRNKMSDVADGYILTGATPNVSTANNSKGLIQVTSSNRAYARFMPNGVGLGNPVTAYSYFSPTIEGNFGSGTKNSVLELYKMDYDNSGVVPAASGVLVGLFSMDDAGRLTFNPASRTGSGTVSGGHSTFQFEAPSYRVLESATSLTVSVIRGGNLSETASVKVKTIAGTAKAPADFTAFAAAGQTVSFAPGETQKNVTITLAGSVANGFQADLSFALHLDTAAPSGSTASTTDATVAIQDTGAGTFSYVSPSYSVNASSNGVTTNPLTVSIKRTLGDNGDVPVSVVEAVGSTLHTPADFTVTPSQTFFDRDSATRSYVITLNSPTKAGVIKLGVGVISPAIAGPAATVTVLTDAKAPTVTLPAITVPPTGIVATFNGTANDTSAAPGVAGVHKVEYSLNNSVFAEMTLGTPDGVATTFAVPELTMENGANTLTIRATDKVGNVSLTNKVITFINSTYAGTVAGSYSGIIKPSGTANNDKSGFITATINGASGSFSGKITVGGVGASFSGLLRSSGAARFNPAPLLDYFYVIDKTEFDSYLGTLTFSVVGSGPSAHIVGQLAEDNTGAPVLGTFDAALTPFGSTHLVTVDFPGTTLLNQTTKGVYNVPIRSLAQAGAFGTDTANWPQGDGATTLTITTTGAATLKGYLADGTVLTAAGKLTAAGGVAIHVPLYKKNGSFAANLAFAPTTDLDFSATDELWIRPAQPRARYYPNGWPNGVTVEVIGAGYVNDAAHHTFGQTADVSTGNSNLVFGAGGFFTTAITDFVNVNNSTLLVKTVPATGASYTLSLPASTGLFSGTFTDTFHGSNKPAYKGVLFVKTGSALNGGYGYFLTIPTTVAYGVTGQSGPVDLVPAP
jgi:hypothetical protein